MSGLGSFCLRLLGLSAAITPALAHAAIVVDGRADEAEWAQAQVFDDFVVTQPFTLGKPAHGMQVRLLGTPEGIAVAYAVEQPAGVPRQKARTARDADIPGDRVNLYIDFDGDGVVAFNFCIGLSGSVQDATMTNENRYSTDWDGDWKYAVVEDEQRWSVELLIPWSVASMGGDDSDTRTVGVLFDRVLGTTAERSTSASETFEHARFVSNFPKVRIAQFRGAALSLFPYASVRQDLITNKLETKAGLDLQWKPSGRFQLAAAINPDFGQVESDQLVVNFDAIETQFSDKRPFFTENQGFFDLRTPNEGQLIYTRRIGGPSDDGSGAAADIDAALKLRGSFGSLNYGVLGALESDYADDLGRAFYAQRFSYPVGTATFGYVSTWTDHPLLQRDALLNAVDVNWRPSESVLLVAQVLTTDIDDPAGDSRDSGEWFRLNLTPPGPLRHELEVTHFGAALDFNDLGYQPRASYNELEWTTEYTQSDFGPDSWRRSTNWHVEPQLRYNDEGDHLSDVLAVSRLDSLRSGATFLTEINAITGGIDDLISRGNGDVKRGPRHSAFLEYRTPRRGDWQTTLGAYWLHEGLHDSAFQPEFSVSYFVSDRLTIGGYLYPRFSNDWLIWQHDDLLARYERTQVQTGLNLDWLPRDRHELRAKLQWFAIDAEDGDGYRIGDDGVLRASGEAQDDFSIKNFGLQVRYRWTFATQSDLYVVYSRGGFARENHDGDDVLDLLADASSLRDADQFLVKVRYRF